MKHSKYVIIANNLVTSRPGSSQRVDFRWTLQWCYPDMAISFGTKLSMPYKINALGEYIYTRETVYLK